MRKAKTWNKQFVKSLKGYTHDLKSEKFSLKEPKYLFSFDHTLKKYTVSPQTDSDMVRCAIHSILHHKVAEVAKTLHAGLVSTESPIEKVFLLALSVVGYNYTDQIIYRLDGQDYGDTYREFSSRLLIQPQSKIGQYRVDFLLTHETYLSELNTDHRVSALRYAKEELIVECDGHQFHERTKHQARYDRRKDRALQELGFKIFRYTGSEIWDDAFHCAHQAIKTLFKWEAGSASLNS
jgi:very-short-patch-repair endonuclease